MRELLKAIGVLQSISNDKRHKNGLKKLGRGYCEAHRLNPFNPLSYLTIIIGVVLGLLLFGVVGFWKETDTKNPFKWD